MAPVYNFILSIDKSTNPYYYKIVLISTKEVNMNTREQIKLVNTALSSTLDLYRIWAKKHDLNYNALIILYTLDDYETCTQKQICEWWALPKQTVHGILLDFEKKGYITITTNTENKRERLISFTKAGKIFAASVLKRLHKMEEKAMEGLSREQREQLIDCNTKYYELLKEEIKNG